MSSSPRSFKTVSEYRDARTPASSPKKVCRIEDAMEDNLPGSIEAALRFFDTEASSSTGNNPRPSGGIAQFMGRAELKHTSELTQSGPAPKVTAARPLRGALNAPKGPIERNDAGQVISVKFAGGDPAEFKYDEAGKLVAFRYASLTWTLEDNGFWRSGDQQSDYRIDGTVEVLHDGSIKICCAEVTRTLKLTGVRIDEHADGSKTESRKFRNAATAFDLLAKSKSVTSVWLSSQPRESQRIDSIQLFESSGPGELEIDEVEIDEESGRATLPMIPLAAVVPASKMEGANVRNLEDRRPARGVADGASKSAAKSLGAESAMLRNAVARMPEQDESAGPGFTVHNLKLCARELLLKSILWINETFRRSALLTHLPAIDALAEIYSQKQENDNAETMHLKALHIKENCYGAKQPELASNICGLAEIYCRRRNFPRAEQLYAEALHLYEQSVRKQLFLFSQNVCEENKLTREVESMFKCIAGLAEVYRLQKKNGSSKDLYETAMDLWTEISDKAEHRLDGVLTTIIERYVALVQAETDHKIRSAASTGASV